LLVKEGGKKGGARRVVPGATHARGFLFNLYWIVYVDFGTGSRKREKGKRRGSEAPNLNVRPPHSLKTKKKKKKKREGGEGRGRDIGLYLTGAKQYRCHLVGFLRHDCRKKRGKKEERGRRNKEDDRGRSRSRRRPKKKEGKKRGGEAAEAAGFGRRRSHQEEEKKGKKRWRRSCPH